MGCPIQAIKAGDMVAKRRSHSGILKPTKPCMMISPAIVPTTELDMPEARSANRKVPAAALPSSGVKLL